MKKKQNNEENKKKITSQKQPVIEQPSQTDKKPVEKGKAGRPEKDDDKKSEKTIQNKEAMS